MDAPAQIEGGLRNGTLFPRTDAALSARNIIVHGYDEHGTVLPQCVDRMKS